MSNERDPFLLFEWPWLLGISTPDGEAKAEDICWLTTKDTPPIKFVPIFTDEHLADEFIINMGDNDGGRIPIRYKLKQWMVSVLTTLQETGVTHVYFDPNIDGTMPANRPFTPIGDLIAKYQ